MKPVYTCSVSKLDYFHKVFFRTDEDKPWIDEQSFLDTLQGKFIQRPEAKYGEAFHAIIDGEAERGAVKVDQDIIPGFKYKEIFIPDAQADKAVQYGAQHAAGIAELAVSKRYETRNATYIVTGRLDRLIGDWIRDCKTKYGQIDIQGDYLDSYQHRFYLDILPGVTAFWYDLFQVSGFSEVKDCLTAKIKPVEPFCVTRYPELSTDVQTCVEEFDSYIQLKGLTQWVEVSPWSRVAKEYKLFEGMVWDDSTVLMCGKYKGKTLAECGEYLQWLAANQGKHIVLPVGLKSYMKGRGLI